MMNVAAVVPFVIFLISPLLSAIYLALTKNPGY